MKSWDLGILSREVGVGFGAASYRDYRRKVKKSIFGAVSNENTEGIWGVIWAVLEVILSGLVVNLSGAWFVSFWGASYRDFRRKRAESRFLGR